MATAVFYLGLILAFPKTAEVMAQFAPHSILGFADTSVPTLWGFFAALLVEGVLAVSFHELKKLRGDARRNAWVAAGSALAFSAIMQEMDVAINQGWIKITDNSPIIILMRVIIPLIPIVMISIFGWSKLNAENNGGGKQNFNKQQNFQNQRQNQPRHEQRQPENGRERAPHPSEAPH